MSERLKILVVDDDDVDRMAVRRALRDTGLEASCLDATDGDAALSALETGRFDCIFLDLWLPRRDGLTVLRDLRARGITTPVIMLTGSGDERTAVELMKAGATDYLRKTDLSAERLEQSLQHALRMHEAEQRAREAQDALRAYAAQMHALSEVSLATHGSLSEPAVLRTIADHTRRLLGVRRAVASAFRHDAASRVAHVASPTPELAPPPSVPLPETAALLRDSMHSVRHLERAAVEASPGHRALLEGAGVSLPEREWIAAPMIGRDGQSLGLMHLCDKEGGDFTDTDRSLLAQMAQIAASALENARLFQEAEAATRTRDDMLAIVSHDLRTPLSVISLSTEGMLAALPQGEEVRRQRTALERIQRAARRMNTLVGDLLDASQIEAGQLPVDKCPNAPAALVEEAVESIRPLAADRSLRLTSSVPEGLPSIEVDRSRILQVFSNLLGNAVKFTSIGGEITVSAEPQPGHVLFSVTDTGPGIPAEDLPHLFDRHWQARATARKGAGLGLFIAKGIVEAHEGVLQVRTQRGVGSTFFFTLPAGAAADER